MSIGNVNYEANNCIIGCIRCGSVTNIALVAHRNSQNLIIGYVFSCQPCLEHVLGKDVVDVLRRES